MNNSNSSAVMFPQSTKASLAAMPPKTSEVASSIQESCASILSNCRICLSSFKMPAGLSCGHRFCEKCLHLFWSEGTKEDYLICPLCRAYVSNIDFEKKSRATSTHEFRKMFATVEEYEDLGVTDSTNVISLCLKMSAVITTLYYLVIQFWVPLECFFKNLQMKWE